VRLFTGADTVFWKAFQNSLIWACLAVVVPMTLSLLLALALNRKMAGRNLFRSVFYIPAVFASITVAAMWRWIYNPTLGAVNQVLSALGLDSWTHQWLGDSQGRPVLHLRRSVWQGVGFNMVLFLAGLQQVPPELVEAAKARRRPRASDLPSCHHAGPAADLRRGADPDDYQFAQGLRPRRRDDRRWPRRNPLRSSRCGRTRSRSPTTTSARGAVATVLLVISLCLVVPYLSWALKGEEN